MEGEDGARLLADRVVFVVGSPRSGTSLVAALLAAHPEIAGAPGESHLFDEGVNALFDNFEATEPWQAFLSTHVSREQLIGLVRQLCDGVFDAVRAREKPGARFVVEKTPYGRAGTELELDRKLACYPDGRYIHVIRDGRAVVRSLRHMQWNSDSAAEAAMRWRRAVDATRDRLTGSPRYRELRYEELIAAPAREMRQVFSWLGARADAEIDATVDRVMRHRFASNESKVRVDPGAWREELTARDLADVQHVAGELLRELGYETADSGALDGNRSVPRQRPAVRRRFAGALRLPTRTATRHTERTAETAIEAFANAVRHADADALAQLLADDVHVYVRTEGTRVEADGEDARLQLLQFGAAMFAERFVGEWWGTIIGDPLCGLWFSGTLASGDSVDLAFALLRAEGQFSAVALLSPS